MLQDLHHALIRCLILLLVCAVLYVITFIQSFISSPECAHLSPSTCKLLFVFLLFILPCPSSLPSRYYYMSNDDLDQLLSLPRSKVCFHVKTARFVGWHHSLPTFGSALALSTRTTHDARTCTLIPNKSVALSASACQVSLH